MTVVAEKPYEYKNPGDGTIVDFSFDFTVDQSSDVEVYIEDNDPTSENYGTRYIKVEGVDYTVEVYSGTKKGMVTFSVPVNVLEKVFLKRVTSLDQDHDYVEGDPFPADSHEGALDKITRQQQEQALMLGAVIRFPEFESGSYVVEIPKKEIRASKSLGFDSDGNISMVDFITQEVLDGIAADAAACEAAILACSTAEDAAEAAQVAAEAAQTASEGVQTAITALLATYPEAANILVSADIGDTVQGYDANTVKSDETATLTKGFKETMFAYTSGNVDAENGNMQTMDTATYTTIGLPNRVGRVLLILTGGGAVGYDAGYDGVVGEYDSSKAACFVQVINTGTGQYLVFANTEA